jgi:hypothetical protein
MPDEEMPISDLTPESRKYLEQFLEDVVSANLPGSETMIERLRETLNGRPIHTPPSKWSPSENAIVWVDSDAALILNHPMRRASRPDHVGVKHQTTGYAGLLDLFSNRRFDIPKARYDHLIGDLTVVRQQSGYPPDHTAAHSPNRLFGDFLRIQG